MVRVLVVDDHAEFRAAACRLFAMPGFEVVGEAPSGEAALEAAAVLKPDLILLDIQLPGIDGFEVAEKLAKRSPPPVVVLVSSRAEATYRRRLRQVPAAGFIAKSELTGEAVSSLVG